MIHDATVRMILNGATLVCVVLLVNALILVWTSGE